MVPAPYDPPHVAIGLWCLAISLATVLAMKRHFELPPIRQFPRYLTTQLRTDLATTRRWVACWSGLFAWSFVVSGLHFGGLEFGWYLIPWWDLLTHLLSGVGVAGILLVGLRTAVPAHTSPVWVIPAVLAIGAGFEVYELLFKSFWQGWSVSFYFNDTAIDLLMDCLGAAVTLPGAEVIDLRTTSSAPTRRYAPADD